MVWHNTPYRYDDFDDADLDDAPDPDPVDVSDETVIVDGSTMTYRSYRRRGGVD
ncbi:hypothetical protein ACFQPA_03745 [Halomarina halobia]|uniref:Uncharacterized protein n=1 Tax=Halomarina halobia TaxID=3033386 RepID=A0ABD6A549_9EURY|nr:hypothetical protein [Halomarina sp. PSR21]